VYDVSRSHEEMHVFSDGVEGIALPLDNVLRNQLITDLDSLFFELNSVCELMEKLFEGLYHAARQPIAKGATREKIKSVISSSKQDSAWFRTLDNYRNFLIHDGAPDIALDISNGSEKYDLIIMKKNIKEFKDPDDFVKLSELKEMVQSFSIVKGVLREHFIGLFDKLEA